MLGFGRKKRWVIERLFEGLEWDTLGSIEGAKDPASAIATARSAWPELPLESENLRAVAWADATAEQREAADYEDNLRADDARMQAHDRDVIAELSAMRDLMRPADQREQTVPRPNDEVILRTGNVTRIGTVMTRGLVGVIIELESGLFAEVERNPDSTSVVRWREVSSRPPR